MMYGMEYDGQSSPRSHTSSDRKRQWKNGKYDEYNDHDDLRQKKDRRREHDEKDDSYIDSIQIQDKDLGPIIGQRGSNIKNLEYNFYVRIDIDKKNLIVHVKGRKKSDVEDACDHIRKQITDNENKYGRHNSNSYGSFDRSNHQRVKFGDPYRSGDNGNYDRKHQHGNFGDSYRDGNGARDDQWRSESGVSGNHSSYYNNVNDASGSTSSYYNRTVGTSSGTHDNWRLNRGSSHSSGERKSGYKHKERNDSCEKRDEKKDDEIGSHPSSDGSSKNRPFGLIDWDAVNKKSEAAAKAKWAKCPPLTKDFYKEKPEVSNLSTIEVERLRMENNNTMVSLVFEEKNRSDEIDIPNPIWEFEQCFDEYPDLMHEIKKQGFKKPSPIQAQAWPILLKGFDLIGISQTGSGKTLAFLLPAMIHTEYQSIPRRKRHGPNVLVLAPTRELALQIESEVKKYSFRDMKAVCVYGGGSRDTQIKDLGRGAEIIICTPGRLNDLIEAKVIDIKTVTFLILDEADRMLDMGFEPQIRKVLLDIRPDRQTVMTSATWPENVRRLARSYMKDPIQVCIGSLDLVATHSVKQIVKIMFNDDQKYKSVIKFIDGMRRHDKAIIFCGRKARADDLSSNLVIAGYRPACIHGDRDQHDREQAISDIKTGYANILVATDIAARGLDIEDITYVINYDMPRSIEEYVHRVGRTGRAGRTGTSITYLTREDWKLAKELIEILEEAKQEVPDDLRSMCSRFAAMKEKRGHYGGKRQGGYQDHFAH